MSDFAVKDLMVTVLPERIAACEGDTQCEEPPTDPPVCIGGGTDINCGERHPYTSCAEAPSQCDSTHPSSAMTAKYQAAAGSDFMALSDDLERLLGS